jgi:hypothetical protein
MRAIPVRLTGVLDAAGFFGVTASSAEVPAASIVSNIANRTADPCDRKDKKGKRNDKKPSRA